MGTRTHVNGQTDTRTRSGASIQMAAAMKRIMTGTGLFMFLKRKVSSVRCDQIWQNFATWAQR